MASVSENDPRDLEIHDVPMRGVEISVAVALFVRDDVAAW